MTCASGYWLSTVSDVLPICLASYSAMSIAHNPVPVPISRILRGFSDMGDRDNAPASTRLHIW